MSREPRRIAVTGAAGYLGVELARRCVARGDVVLGLDVRRPPQRWPDSAGFALQDVTDTTLRARLEEFRPEVLVHLAWVFDPVHDREREQQIDVDGTRNAFEAATAAGARRIVYPSSTTSYGIDPARRRPLTEQDPPAPQPPAYRYGRFKAEVERWLPAFRDANPEVELVVARACIVLGPDTRNIVTHVTGWPVIFRVAGHDPPLQFLHQDDAVELLAWMIDAAPPSTFNAAGAGVMSLREVCRMAGKPCVPLPAWLLYPLVALGWRTRLLRFPPGLLDYMRYPWVADVGLLTETLGFRPRHDTRDALAAYLSVSGRTTTRARARGR